MDLMKFFDRFLREDTQVCICSEKSMNILYSGTVGECYLGLAKTTNFLSLYPHLVDDEDIGIIVTLTPAYYEWRNKVDYESENRRVNDEY